jgi:two-component system chemotaxis response regulator CheY
MLLRTFVEAGDGAEGVSKFDPQLIDLVFIDWNMPRMTGIEFARKIRKMKSADQIPLIMITSEKTMDKVEVALNEAGVNAYISKPFTVKELQYKLTKVLESRNQPAKKPSGFFSKLMG